jgi:(R)-2-hydroxyacyl-CoA dehydratese activating ATPase
MIYAGMDIGSRTIKTALFDTKSQTMIACKLRDQGLDQQNLTRNLYTQTLSETGLVGGDIARSVATGYGRSAIDFADTTVTEITCHAAGVLHLHPDARTIIDIGGEDSKVIRLDDRGKVQDFVMNDRCAAGTGRFLEIVAQRLEGDLYSVAHAAERCGRPVVISSMCVVFAETEIIGLLASGTPVEEIMAGVQKAIASRIVGMVGRQARPPFYFTGGVSLVPGMTQALSSALGCQITVSRNAQFTGALGAAIMASRQAA